jgi:plasmid stabilization system protein ParE
MTEMGEVVVAELCDLVADVIDQQPAAASKVARRLATSIRSQQADGELIRREHRELDERRLKLDEQLVAKGKRPRNC